MLLLLLAACPLEQLGVELPPAGGDSITLDDVQRDTRGLLKAEPDAFYARRMEQMGFRVERGEGWVCGARGDGPARTILAPWPEDVDTAAAGAVLISLAKGWDSLDGMPFRRRLCIGRAGATPPVEGERSDVGPLGPGGLTSVSPYRSGTPDPTRRVEALDYRDLARKARTLFLALE